MREIMKDRYLFKAKRIDNGEWVEGLLAVMWGQYHIINPNDENTAYPIVYDTICQYTGLLDKSGKKIWENDVCRYVDADECVVKEEIFVVKYGRHAEMCKINIGFYIDWIKTDYYRCDLAFFTENRNVEVIGNTFDNADLLREEVD